MNSQLLYRAMVPEQKGRLRGHQERGLPLPEGLGWGQLEDGDERRQRRLELGFEKMRSQEMREKEVWGE